jgi:hypothetical protein
MRDEDDPRGESASGDARTGGGGSSLTVVGELMEQCRRYESWLEALAARRAETAKHVFTRVHADYTARLEAVMKSLTSQVDGLRTELTVLATRIASLEEQQHRARDERAEAELRAHVGELSPDGWAEMAAASDASIASLAAQHEQAVRDLRRTRQLLADAERPATPVQAAAPVAAPVRRPAVPPEDPLAAVSDVAEAAMHVPSADPSAPPPADDTFDELAFLNSVVSAPSGTTPVSPPAPAPPPARPAAASPPPVSPPRAEPPRAVPPPVPRPVPRPAPRPTAPRPAAPARADSGGVINLSEAQGPQLESKRHADGPLAANITGNNPIILRDRGDEAMAKTLKCAECGALNYPTEWYCERCGAELASL